MVITMLDVVKSSLTLEAINKIKIFSYFKDEEFRSPEKVDILKIRINDFVSKNNETNENKIEYEAVYPPESDFFVIEFMTTTTFIRILKSYDFAQDQFDQAELSITTELKKALGIILNDLKY